MRYTALGVLTTMLLTATGCGDDDDPIFVGENTRLEVLSDPAGAAIALDDAPTGRTTPTTFFDIAGGRHGLEVRLDRDGIGYGYRTEVDIRGDSLHRVHGPLMFRCSSEMCLLASARPRDFGNLRLSSQANGALFMQRGFGNGLFYPLGTTNSLVSMGMPLIAMVSGARDTLALGIFDTEYLAGRPEPVYQAGATRITLQQSTWIIPPTGLIIGNSPTVRGIEVEEELIGPPLGDIVFVHLTFRNITDRDTYRAADPVVPNGGLTFNNVYIGFALDTDIGLSQDDLFGYEAADSLIFAYDADFLESTFSPEFMEAPPLVGLKIVEKPAGATAVAMNGWPAQVQNVSADWQAGTAGEPEGYYRLSGLRSIAPDYTGQFIGHMATQPNDYRVMVSAGPLTLAPGESTAMTVAVIVAPPVAGEFVPGQAVEPGDPGTTGRQITRIAATLIERARNLTIP